jgi:arginyl-tRNA synthetase
LIEFQDAKIARVSYPSDIGLSVAKGIWGLEKTKGDPNDIKALGVAYKIGNDAYEDAKENNGAKKEIEEINRSLYDNSNKEWNGLRKAGLKVSLKHLLEICRELGTKFDLEFFESEAAPVGQTIVEKNIGGVFEKSDGAIIFKGEKHDLHTRVFITREGLPTYETKELGLFELKRKTLPDFNLSITVTSVEQNEYFKVLRAVIGEIFKDELNGREVRHIGHGFLRLPSGKMSSRKGNVVTGESLIEEMKKMALEKMRERPFSEGQKEKIAEQVAVAAIKFSILKQKIGKDIVFDPEQSLSFEGDSGPYLQYAHTRCASILKKAQQQNQSQNKSAAPTKSAPHLLERLVVQFPDVTLRAATEEAPQLVVTYLVNLASAFNHFYASEKIIGSPDENHLLNIVSAVKAVLKNGLWLLGIEALEEM